MFRLTNLLRRSPIANLEIVIRGPKKKKGQSEGKIESTDIINIFKERKDPEPLDIRQYPVYVQEFSLGQNSVHQLTTGVEHNIKTMLPNQSTYKSFLRGMKRIRCKNKGAFRHMDQKIDILNQKFDINSRRALYNIFSNAAQELQKQMQKERLQAEAAADQDDQ